MRIVGINPNWSVGSNYAPTDTLRPPRSFPLEWGYIHSSANHLKCVSFVFIDLYRSPRLQIGQELIIRHADVVVISTAPSYLFWRCPPLDLTAVRRTVNEVRRVSEAKTVLIGPHGTVLPIPTLRSTGADAVFRGEPDDELLQQVEVFLARGSGQYIATLQCPDVDICREAGSLREIDYLQPGIASPEPHTWIPRSLPRQPSALIETARGCSFDCPFCLRSGFRRQLRLKSLDSIANELNALQAIGVQYVYLIDENFGLPISHATDVIRLLSEREIKFGCQTRPDIWSEERIRQLAAAGCVYVELGMESVDRDLLATFEKFSRPGWAWIMRERFQEFIPTVGLNCFDVVNPDIKGKNLPLSFDQYGDTASPFIPYPTTPWGDKAIRRYGHSEISWERVSALHGLYSLLSKRGFTGQALRRSLSLRRLVVVALYWRNYYGRIIGKRAAATRHEALSPKRPHAQ